MVHSPCMVLFLSLSVVQMCKLFPWSITQPLVGISPVVGHAEKIIRLHPVPSPNGIKRWSLASLCVLHPRPFTLSLRFSLHLPYFEMTLGLGNKKDIFFLDLKKACILLNVYANEKEKNPERWPDGGCPQWCMQ